MKKVYTLFVSSSIIKQKTISFLCEHRKFLCLGILLLCITCSISAQSVGDYRSKTLTSPPNRNWSTPGNWERYNGTAWVTATQYPTAADGVITIKAGDSIAVNIDITVDQLVIEANAKLGYGTSTPIVKLTVADGPGIDLLNNGTLTLTDTTNSDAWLILNGQMVNNNTVIIETDCQLNVYGKLSNNKDIYTKIFTQTGTGGASWYGKLNIFSGGFIDCSPNSKVYGAGNFTLNAGATIEIGSPEGISALGTTTGNIQTTHIRYFSPEAIYIYNGEGAQITGTGLTKAAGVKIANTASVTGRTVTFTQQVSMDYLKIDPDAKADLGIFTHPAGSLILPPQSYAEGKHGGTGLIGVPAENIHSDYFTDNTGCVDLKNYAIIVYSSSGTFTPCSASDFNAIIEAWGGGGCGAAQSSNGAGGGGGGGAYARRITTITPGTPYTINIGKGSDNGDTPGGDSWFAPKDAPELVLAKGGNSVRNDDNNGANGGDKAACIGDVTFLGGKGALSNYDGSSNISKNYGGGGGASAGASGAGANATGFAGATATTGGGNGGGGKQGNTGVGNPGASPGGGGGGAYQNVGTGTPSIIKGGPGADGLIKLTYPPIFPKITMKPDINACSGSPVDLPYTALENCPDMYKIEFSDAALAAGFIDVPYTNLPPSVPGAISLTVPDGVTYGTTYKANLTVKNKQTGFPSGSYPLSITIKQNIWEGTTSTDWYTVSNWSCEIPKATSDITIPASAPNQPHIALKPATATETARCRNIIIESGASVTVDSVGVFTVFGKMTNNNNEDGLIIKAGKTKPNGSFILKDPSQNPNTLATVQMYAKGFKGDQWWVTTPDNKYTYSGFYRWQFFGIPLQTMQASPTLNGSYVREYIESQNMNDYYLKWKDITTWDRMYPFKGYEITQAIDPGQYKLITFRGSLVTADKTLELGRTTVGGTINYGSGSHIFGNSYTAAIDITKMQFSDEVEKTVYIYTTGSLKDWQDALAVGETLNTPGEYISIPQNLAPTPLLPGEIPSMQGFCLTLMPDKNNGTVFIPYNSTTSSVKDNTYAQRVKPNGAQKSNRVNAGQQESAAFSCITVDVLSNGGSDRTWLFSQPGTTHGFDNGWDGRKMTFGKVCIYSDEKDEMYQVNTVDDVNNTYLSFRAADSITNYTLKIKDFNLLGKYDYLKLVDLATNQEIPLINDVTLYNFTASNTLLPEKRFLISTQRTATSIDNKISQTITIFASGQTIYLRNSSSENGTVEVSDIKGSIVLRDVIGANSIKNIHTVLNEGIYLVKIKTNSQVKTGKIVLKK